VFSGDNHANAPRTVKILHYCIATSEEMLIPGNSAPIPAKHILHTGRRVFMRDTIAAESRSYQYWKNIMQ
jgi:hypothetical protein